MAGNAAIRAHWGSAPLRTDWPSNGSKLSRRDATLEQAEPQSEEPRGRGRSFPPTPYSRSLAYSAARAVFRCPLGLRSAMMLSRNPCNDIDPSSPRSRERTASV